VTLAPEEFGVSARSGIPPANMRPSIRVKTRDSPKGRDEIEERIMDVKGVLPSVTPGQH